MKRHGLMPALALLMLVASACASPESTAYRLNEDGSLAYYQGDYAKALELFRQAQVARPDLAELNLNAGAAMAKDGDHERSLRELRRVFSTDDLKLRSKAHYDIGTLHAQDQYEDEAIEELKWALRLDNTDTDAKHNLEVLVQRKLQREEEARRQQQQQQRRPQQPQQPGDEEGEPNEQQQQPGQQGQPDQSGSPSNETGSDAQQPPNGPRTPPSSPQALSDALDAAGIEIDIEDALRILDALRDRERQIQSDLNRGGSRGNQVDKDW